MKDFKLDPIKFELSKKGTAGKMTTEDNEAYVKAAETVGIEKKTLEQVSSFDQEFISAAFDQAVAGAEKEFISDKELDNITVSIPFGTKKSDVLVTDITRSKTYPIPGTDKKVTKPKIKVIVKSARYAISNARIKRVEDEIKSKIIND